MPEAVVKNLWLLLTVVIPGLFTYGFWRLLLLLEPSKYLDYESLKQIDDSAVASTAVIIAFSLIQQAFALAIESSLALVATFQQKRWPYFYSLFRERFVLEQRGELNDHAIRLVGGLFLSINIAVGLLLLALYFLCYEHLEQNHWVVIALFVFFVAAFASIVYRMVIAKQVIAACSIAADNRDGEPERWKE